MKQFISDFQKTPGFKFCGWIAYFFIIFEVIFFAVVSNSKGCGEFGCGLYFLIPNLFIIPIYVISYFAGSIIGIKQRGKYKKFKIILSIGYILGLIAVFGSSWFLLFIVYWN